MVRGPSKGGHLGAALASFLESLGELGISRGKVLRALKNGGHRARRPLLLDRRDDLLRELFKKAEGNVALVHQRLKAVHGVDVSYPTVYRRALELDLLDPADQITVRFDPPGEKSQSDTSEYVVDLGGMPTKVILFDNTHLAILSGTGKDAEIVPDMAEFARALGFVWLAHELGHADRKGKEERGFLFAETNFLPGRTFRDLGDLNAQYAEWLAGANVRKHGTTHQRPLDRLVVERRHLLPLPRASLDLSEVVARKVTIEGFVTSKPIATRYQRDSLARPRASTPTTTASASSSARIWSRPCKMVATHERMRDNGRRVTDLSHHPRPEPQRNEGRIAYLAQLHARHPACAEFMTVILEHHPNHFNTARRRLDELIACYPAKALKAAAERATRFRAYDIRTLERILDADWHSEGDFIWLIFFVYGILRIILACSTRFKLAALRCPPRDAASPAPQPDAGVRASTATIPSRDNG